MSALLPALPPWLAAYRTVGPASRPCRSPQGSREVAASVGPGPSGGLCGAEVIKRNFLQEGRAGRAWLVGTAGRACQERDAGVRAAGASACEGRERAQEPGWWMERGAPTSGLRPGVSEVQREDVHFPVRAAGSHETGGGQSHSGFERR